MALSCTRGHLDWLSGRIYSQKGQALEWAAQGGDGIDVLGGVSEICGCGTTGCGLVVDLVVLG